MHGKRVLAALVFLPLFYLVVSYPSSLPFFIVAAAACVLGQIEFYRMYSGSGMKPLVIPGILAGLALMAVFEFDETGRALSPVLTVIVLGLATLRLFSPRDTKDALTELAVTIAGIFYVSWLLGHHLLLRGLDENGYFIFFLYLTTWAGDTGAYYAGSFWGRHKFYEKISPKKTWEGAVGGLALGVAAALLARYWFLPVLSPAECVLLGCLIGVAGPVGDLVESLMKRSLSVKDSGAIIPGHGGILDRIDSLLFSGPVLYYYLKYLR